MCPFIHAWERGIIGQQLKFTPVSNYYIFARLPISVYMCMHVCAYSRPFILMCVSVCLHACVCTFVCVSVCVHACMFMCTVRVCAVCGGAR